MKIYLTRHGQTNLNLKRIMQGLTDEPLNEKGIQQAKDARTTLNGIHFDAVYSSPLIRARKTASIIGDVPEEDVIIDPRIIEMDFGKYEGKNYYGMGLRMSLFWMFPTLLSAPKTVETIPHLRERTSSFLKEIEQMPYDNVLLVCHGGVMRALSGYLEERPNGLRWRPRPKNCEIRIYEYKDGKHTRLQ